MSEKIKNQTDEIVATENTSNKKCCVCQTDITPKNRCRVKFKPICVDCAFPGGGITAYHEFKHELALANREKEEETAYRNKKMKLRMFGLLILIFVLIDVLLVYLSYIAGWPKIYIAGPPLFLIVYFIVIKVKKESFVPISEREFYKQKYGNGFAKKSKDNSSLKKSFSDKKILEITPDLYENHKDDESAVYKDDKGSEYKIGYFKCDKCGKTYLYRTDFDAFTQTDDKKVCISCRQHA